MTDTGRTDTAAIAAALDVARADLLDALAGVTQDEFERGPPGGGRAIRDVLWRAGLVEDWHRRAASLGSAGRPPPAYHDRERPAIAQGVDYLLAWLEQCRRPTLALLRRLSHDDLGREVALPEEGTRTVRGLLEDIARHERERTDEVRALRR